MLCRCPSRDAGAPEAAEGTPVQRRDNEKDREGPIKGRDAAARQRSRAATTVVNVLVLWVPGRRGELCPLPPALSLCAQAPPCSCSPSPLPPPPPPPVSTYDQTEPGKGAEAGSAPRSMGRSPCLCCNACRTSAGPPMAAPSQSPANPGTAHDSLR